MQSPDNRYETLATIPPQLLQRAKQLEKAWRELPAEGPPPDLRAYLPPASDPQRPSILRELVRVDLEMRWSRRLPAFLESYLQQFPELGGAATLSPEMILHEFCVRRQHGDQPQLSVYLERFPTQYRRLQTLAEERKVLAATDKAGQTYAAGKNAVPTNHPLPPQTGAASPPEKEPSGHELPTIAPVVEPSKKKEATEKAPPAAAKKPQSGEKASVQMMGEYRFLKRLGAGALGEVWKAEAPGGVEVAVKRLSRSLDSDDAQQELQSLEHVKNLRHPYLAQIQNFWPHKGRLYIVMELADGSLEDRLEHYRKQGLPGIPPDELLGYMREAAEALDYLHTANVHHRDIKPANILLLNGHVKVADFGLARPLQSERSVVDATFCGTPAYMAPEVWDNKFSTHSDQWSLAVTYLELRLNRRFFKNRSLQGLMLEIRKGQFDLSSLGTPERRVLRRALHQNPRQRYPTCTAFVQALQTALQPPPPRPPRRWRPIPTAILILACLAAGGLVASIIVGSVGRTAQGPIEPLAFQVDTGKQETVTFEVPRDRFKLPIKDARDEKDNRLQVTIEQSEVGENKLRITVTLHALPVAPPGELIVPLRAADGEKVTELHGTILFVPPNFEPVDKSDVTKDHGVKYYRRLRWKLPNHPEEIEFLLIPQEDRSDEAQETYYISRDKITRGQFALMVAENPSVIEKKRWEQHAKDDPRMPVRSVTFEEAFAFAKWIDKDHGALPTLKQWDKAAGLYHPKRGQDPWFVGPYQGRWTDNPRPEVAVGNLEKPVGAGQSRHDISPYGCRDMAGNGFEWTRSLVSGKNVPRNHKRGDPLQGDVYFRGQDCNEEEPLSFQFMDNKLDWFRCRATDFHPRFGFRIVIEPNP
jgi:serine/threonine protein kinase